MAVAVLRWCTKKRCGTIRCSCPWRASSRHEQAPLFLDLGCRSGTEIGGNAAVDDVQDEDRLPFLSFGRMDGRQDQIVLVGSGSGTWSLVASGRSRRVGRESASATGNRPRSVRVAAGRLAASPHPRASARDAVRTIGARDSSSAGQPALPLAIAAPPQQKLPILSRPRGGAGISSSAPIGLGWSAIASRTRCAEAGPTPGMSCMTRKPATRSRGFSTKRSSASRSLTCAASRNFRPPNLTKGILRRVSSISSGPL